MRCSLSSRCLVSVGGEGLRHSRFLPLNALRCRNRPTLPHRLAYPLLSAPPRFTKVRVLAQIVRLVVPVFAKATAIDLLLKGQIRCWRPIGLPLHCLPLQRRPGLGLGCLLWFHHHFLVAAIRLCDATSTNFEILQPRGRSMLPILGQVGQMKVSDFWELTHFSFYLKSIICAD